MVTIEALPDATFNSWAIVDVMGHQRFIGRVSEQVIAGQGFIVVEVPDIDGDPPYSVSFTKFLGAKSIYMIEPVSEETALAMCKRGKQLSIGQRFVQQEQAPRLSQSGLQQLADFIDDDDDDDFDEDDLP